MGFVEQHNGQSYEFGTFRLVLDERRLYRQGELVPLPPKEFDLLLLLVRNARQPLGRDNLIKALWPNTVVEEANLNVHISALRKALAEGSGEQQYIETLPRLGYRFVAPVIAVDEPEAALLPVSIPDQPGNTKLDAAVTEMKQPEWYAVTRLASLKTAVWLLAIGVIGVLAFLFYMPPGSAPPPPPA